MEPKVNTSFDKLVPINEKEKMMNSSFEEPNKSTSQLGNPLRSSLEIAFYHSKTQLRDTVFDPITGEVRKYSVERSPSRSLGNAIPSMHSDVAYIAVEKSPETPEKLLNNHTRSFSYGVDEMLVKKSPYSSARASRVGSPDKKPRNSDKSMYDSQNNFTTKPKTNFGYDPIQLLNSTKVFKGMGYQKSKIF